MKRPVIRRFRNAHSVAVKHLERPSIQRHAARGGAHRHHVGAAKERIRVALAVPACRQEVHRAELPFPGEGKQRQPFPAPLLLHDEIQGPVGDDAVDVPPLGLLEVHLKAQGEGGHAGPDPHVAQVCLSLGLHQQHPVPPHGQRGLVPQVAGKMLGDAVAHPAQQPREQAVELEAIAAPAPGNDLIVDRGNFQRQRRAVHDVQVLVGHALVVQGLQRVQGFDRGQDRPRVADAVQVGLNRQVVVGRLYVGGGKLFCGHGGPPA